MKQIVYLHMIIYILYNSNQRKNRTPYETYMKGFAKGNEKGFFVSLPQITLKPYRYGDTEERSLL